MFLLSFIRVIKFSLQDIGRNIWLSLVTVTILILALFSINLLLVVQVISQSAVAAVKDKIDVSLYIKNDATEDKIMALKANVSNLPQVKVVDYISKQQALDSFRDKHKNDPQILQALIELGMNPLSPSLIVRPKDSAKYDELISSLTKIDDEIIESRNFDDYKAMISKINAFSAKASQTGITISLIFVLITILVVYNSIRVAIYTHRREIAIMKLVGASNWFIRSPYFVSSIIYTLAGVIISTALLYPLMGLLQPYLKTFFVDSNFNLFFYFNQNFFMIFGLEFLGAMLINILASLVAVGKYSKV